MNLSPLPVQKFFDNAGKPLNGGLLFTYVATTTTKIATYTDSTGGTPNTNPIVLNFRGEANIWLDQTLTYKFVLAPANDTDPPTAPIWSVDNISAALTLASLTQQIIGLALYPRTQAEINQGVVPVNYFYPEGYVDRYATNTTPGTTDMTNAIQFALNVQNDTASLNATRALGGVYLTGTINWPGNNLSLVGAGSAYSYNSSATPHTIFRAKTGTTIVFDLVQTGLAEDRTGNLLEDFEVDGASIAAVGIDMAGTNILERLRVRGCTTAGVRLSNFTNSSRIVRCGLNQNSGWGLQATGASTTTFSVADCLFSLNTLGGADLEAGVVVHFTATVCESNAGPGLRIFRPATHANAMNSFVFDSCWFEDNGATAPNYTIVIDANTRAEANAPEKITFRNCRVNPSTATRKHMLIGCAKWLTFEYCQFDASTASDTLTLTSTAFYVAWIESAQTTGFVGLSATQIDNAIAQGVRCYSSDRAIVRTVGSGAPAVAFTNAWVNFGAPYGSAAYWFDEQGNVKLKGAIKTGAVTSSAFTLPVGYRPANTIDFAVDSNNAYGMVRIASTGTVTPQVGSNSIFNLDEIEFSVG